MKIRRLVDILTIPKWYCLRSTTNICLYGEFQFGVLNWDAMKWTVNLIAWNPIILNLTSPDTQTKLICCNNVPLVSLKKDGLAVRLLEGLEGHGNCERIFRLNNVIKYMNRNGWLQLIGNN